jgi:hypothetical protein
MSAYQEIKNALRRLYLEDNRPWLVGYSGGKAEPGGARRSFAANSITVGTLYKLYANASNGEGLRINANEASLN